MINEFVRKWEAEKARVESTFKKSHPREYKDTV